MVNFEKEELLKVVKLSGLSLSENELESFREKLQCLINYTNEINQAKTPSIPETKTLENVFREDKAIPSKFTEDLLKQAPETDNNYFIVPKIL